MIFRLFKKFGQPDLDWIQLEITTRCNSECIYCPHIFYSDTKDMPLSIFCKIIPFLKNTRLVYLQGWGEPLLNQNIFEMIRLCKLKGRQVGFTTNGMLLDEQTINALIELKLDILCISLAGTTPDTHNGLRKGNTFEKIISNLLLLNQIKSIKGSTLPRLHLAYIMLKSNFEEIRDVISLAKMLNAKQVVASNLTLILRKDLYEASLFNNKINLEYYVSVLKEIKEKALTDDIVFDYRNPILLESFQQCSENVTYSSVIDVDGNVSPCVFTMPSLYKNLKYCDEKIPVHYFKDKIFPVYELNFGNITYESFGEIWNKMKYTDFRKIFNLSKRVITYPNRLDVPDCCKSCYKSLSA